MLNTADPTAGFEILGGFQQDKQWEALEAIPLSIGSRWDNATGLYVPLK